MGFLDSVKDIAGKFGESVERGAKTVSDNSKKFAEKNKLKREVSTVESNLNADYIELGKALFAKICDDPENEFADTVSDIKEKNSRLAELRNMMMALEDKSVCPNCGAEIAKDQAFCDKCGQKLNPETEKVIEDVSEITKVVEVEAPDENSNN